MIKKQWINCKIFFQKLKIKSYYGYIVFYVEIYEILFKKNHNF